MPGPTQRARTRRSACSVAWLLALGLTACSSSPGERDDADDEAPTGARDAGTRADGGTRGDAAVRSDAGAGSPGTRDASTPLDARAPAPDARAASDAASSSESDAQPPGSGPSDAAVPPGSLSAAQVGVPPTYTGTTGASDACAKSYRTFGFAPVDAVASKHPLFLYFAGTAGGSADESARYDNKAAARVTESMARRGFVALSVEYDNALTSFFANKQPCLFDSQRSESLLAKACALPSVDCTLGIATWGHSQGALLAHAAGNFDPRVRAVWTTGYSGLAGAKLAADRFRTVNGEGDTMNAAVATSNKTAGFDASACLDAGRSSCLRADGSGWIIVRKAECQLNAADHCWFNKRSCSENAETLEPSWSDLGSTRVFALEESTAWVATTVARP